MYCKLFTLKDITVNVLYIHIYSHLISSTTLVHAICMRPRLLLKVPTKNYDPGKLFG